jgi:hypothetical protein
MRPQRGGKLCAGRRYVVALHFKPRSNALTLCLNGLHCIQPHLCANKSAFIATPSRAESVRVLRQRA